MSSAGDSLMWRIGVIVILLGIGTSLAYGQAKAPTARVTYVAGNNVYVAVGRDAGILPGDTLSLALPGGELQKALVRSAMRDRSVLELPGAADFLRPGDLLQLTGYSDLATETPADSPSLIIPPPIAEESAPTRSPTSSKRASTSRRRSRFNGRIMTGVGGLHSETKSSTGLTEPTSRGFITPWASLQLQGRDLPYDLAFRTRLRVDYRHTTGRPTSPDLLVRAYEAVVERSFTGGAVQIGRFSNRYAVTGGYWDGVLVEYGPKDSGIGASFGFLPIRSNGSFSTETPKVALFAHNRHRVQNLRQTIFGWYQEIYLPGLQPSRRNFGLSHRAQLSGIASNNRIELDRDPESGNWVVTRGSAQLSGRINRWVSVRGRYEIRQPYSMYRPFAVISYRRDQITTGATIQFQRSSLGADVVWNYSYRPGESRAVDGTSFRLYAGASLSPTLRFTAAGNYWTSTNGNSSLFNFGASRSFARVFTRLNYQYSRSTRFATNVASHVVSAGLSAPLSRRIRSTADVRFQGGSNLTSVAFNVNFTLAL
jgi:hypothetical protein